MGGEAVRRRYSRAIYRAVGRKANRAIRRMVAGVVANRAAVYLIRD